MIGGKLKQKQGGGDKGYLDGPPEEECVADAVGPCHPAAGLHLDLCEGFPCPQAPAFHEAWVEVASYHHGSSFNINWFIIRFFILLVILVYTGKGRRRRSPWISGCPSVMAIR